MKKLFIGLSALVLLAAAGCNNAERSSSDGSDSIAPTTDSTENSSADAEHSNNEPGSPGELTVLTDTVMQYFDVAACGTDDGLYYMDPPRIGSGGSYLYYIDYATKQEIYVCPDSACTHNNERCVSYFDNSEFSTKYSKLFVYGESLFYLSLSYHESDGAVSTSYGGAGGGGTLWQMNLDGTDRRCVFTFDDELAVESFAACDGEKLWFVVSTPELGYNAQTQMYWSYLKDMAVIGVSISDHKVVDRLPLPNDERTAFYRIEGCAGDKFIFTATEYPEGVTKQDVFGLWAERDLSIPFTETTEQDIKTDEIEARSSKVYYTLDRATGDFSELYRYPYNTFFTNSVRFDDKIYLMQPDSAVTIDVKSGTVSEGALTAAEGYNIKAVFGDMYLCSSLSDPDDHAAYFVDPDTGVVGKTELRSNKYPEDTIVSDVAAIGREYVLIRTGEIAIPNKHLGIAGYYYEYAVEKLDDFFGGKDALETVRIIPKG